jgi:hypothetical protein
MNFHALNYFDPMVFVQGTEEFVGSNITLFQALPTHVKFEVSITPSWVVEELNGLESSHSHFSYSGKLGF